VLLALLIIRPSQRVTPLKDDIVQLEQDGDQGLGERGGYGNRVSVMVMSFTGLVVERGRSPDAEKKSNASYSFYLSSLTLQKLVDKCRFYT